MTDVVRNWVVDDRSNHSMTVIGYSHVTARQSRKHGVTAETLTSYMFLSRIRDVVVKGKHIVVTYTAIHSTRDATGTPQRILTDLSISLRRYNDARDDDVIARLRMTML